jgi:hypothetical protein
VVDWAIFKEFARSPLLSSPTKKRAYKRFSLRIAVKAGIFYEMHIDGEFV